MGKFFGVMLKVFIIFVFLVAALDVLQLAEINNFLINDVLGFIPKVISAALIVVIGLVAANFVSNLVCGNSPHSKVDGGLAAKITKWSIVILSITIAIGELVLHRVPLTQQSAA